MPDVTTIVAYAALFISLWNWAMTKEIFYVMSFHKRMIDWMWQRRDVWGRRDKNERDEGDWWRDGPVSEDD